MKLRDNKGSITVFVLVGLLFMSAFLILSYGSNVNKSKTAKEMFNIISDIYSYKDGDENAYMRAYTALRKQNAQEMTSSSENSSSLELTKTFYGPVSNYRIYGNSVQDGTPSPDNPVEVESVGDLVNLFNPNATLETVGVYLGINTTGIDKNYTLKIKLKEGKTVPTGVYFGFVYYVIETATGASANWIISDGALNTTYGDGTSYGLTTFNPSDNYLTGICCHSGTQDVWNSIMDAFEITWVEGTYTAETIPEYVPYGKYRIPVKVSGENEEQHTFNIYLDEPLRKIGDVADYIDFSTGKVERKIGKIESYNGETIVAEWISSTGELGAGATVYYVLDTIIYEDIELPEILAYEDYTKIEVLTEVAPSKIEVTYDGYTFEK